MNATAGAAADVTSSGEIAYREMRRRIGDGQFLPGERLTELSLSEDLGMSRTPVREAIHRLQADGLVVPAGRGVAVAALSPQECVDFYRFRASLDALAAGLAAERQRDGYLPPVALRELDTSLHAVEAAVARGDTKGVVRSDLALHRDIAVLAGNSFVEDVALRLADRAAISFISASPADGWSAKALGQHTQIVEAIGAGRPAEAEAAARQHVLDALATFEENAAG